MKKLLFLIMATFLFSETLNIYCSITMKNAMNELKREFIKTHPNVKIKTVYGSSGKLLKKLKFAKKADLYLPGGPKFVLNNPNLFSTYKEIGFNQIAIFVQKGNPKKILTLGDFLRKDVRVGIGKEDSIVGRNAREVLLNYGGEKFLRKVLSKAKKDFTSIELANELRKGDIDTALNWRAVLNMRDNKEYMEIVNIPEIYAPKKKLLLAVTNFSKNKELANEFLDFAASPKGEEIMKKWGFR